MTIKKWIHFREKDQYLKEEEIKDEKDGLIWKMGSLLPEFYGRINLPNEFFAGFPGLILPEFPVPKLSIGFSYIYGLGVAKSAAYQGYCFAYKCDSGITYMLHLNSENSAWEFSTGIIESFSPCFSDLECEAMETAEWAGPGIIGWVGSQNNKKGTQ